MSFRPAILAAVLLGLFTACSRQPAQPKLTRLAVLRFENLGSDPSTDWMGRAFSEIISAELAAVPGISAIPPSQLRAVDRQTGVHPVSAPGISTERTAAILAGANRIAYGDYFVRGDKLYARLTLEDPATGHTAETLDAETAAGDIYTAASTLARQLSASAGKYATTNATAIQAYMTASESRDAAAIGENAAKAVAADPNFGPAYRMLAEIKARQQDVAGALDTLQKAAARGDAIPAPERARIALEAATLRNDQPARRQALIDLSKAEPHDIDVERSLGELSYALRDYPGAIQAYQKALAAEPDNVASLNSMAYAYAYSGNLDSAVGALKRYQTLAPNDANAWDSMGDVYLISGKLEEAEQAYLQAAKKSPTLQGGSDYFKAAMSRLMRGDLGSADALEKQCEELPGVSREAAVYRHAEWLWITGRRTQGAQQLAAFAQSAPNPELASRAYSEMTLWALLQDDRNGATESLRKALEKAGPASGPTAALMKLMIAPPSAPPVEQARNSLPLAYAYLVNRQFDKALPILQAVYQKPAGNDESLPVLLAWALIETGHASDAAPLLRFNPVPPITGPGLFTPLYFPRFFQLRAKAGIDAEKNTDLYKKLSAARQ